MQGSEEADPPFDEPELEDYVAEEAEGEAETPKKSKLRKYGQEKQTTGADKRVRYSATAIVGLFVIYIMLLVIVWGDK